MTSFADILATHDLDQIRAEVTRWPLPEVSRELGRALQQGWDGTAAQVIRTRPEAIVSETWVKAWNLGNRKSADALLAMGQPWPANLDVLEEAVLKGWEDLLLPIIERSTPSQLQATEALGQAIQAGQPRMIEQLLPHLDLWGSHLITALEHGHVSVFDDLWGKVPPKEVHEALEAHVALGYYDHRVDFAEAVIDPMACRLNRPERTAWIAWAQARHLPLPQAQALNRLDCLSQRSKPLSLPRHRPRA